MLLMALLPLLAAIAFSISIILQSKMENGKVDPSCDPVIPNIAEYQQLLEFSLYGGVDFAVQPI